MIHFKFINSSIFDADWSTQILKKLKTEIWKWLIKNVNSKIDMKLLAINVNLKRDMHLSSCSFSSSSNPFFEVFSIQVLFDLDNLSLEMIDFPKFQQVRSFLSLCSGCIHMYLLTEVDNSWQPFILTSTNTIEVLFYSFWNH